MFLASPITTKDGSNEQSTASRITLIRLCLLFGTICGKGWNFFILYCAILVSLENWPELYKYQAEVTAILLLLAGLPRRVKIALRIVPTRRRGETVANLGEADNLATPSSVPDVFVSPPFANASVIYSQMPWSVLGKRP